MKRYEESEIKLRPDGSIDIARYMARGRERRSEAAREMVRGIVPERKFLSLRRWLLTVPATQ